MPQILRHDDFYGTLHMRKTVPGFTLAHRVADCLPDAVETHTHLDAHFVLVTSGRYISSARAATEHRLPLIYNPPGTTHRDHFVDGVGSFFSVSASADPSDSAMGRAGQWASFLIDNESRALAWALLWASSRCTHDSELHLESLALELMAAAGSRGPSAVPGDRQCGRPMWLDRAYELLQDEYSQPPSVRELALSAGVHPVHLARAFRKHFRCTPGQLIQLRRLERAANLMLFSESCLTDIALACGFTDQSHMTTSFRQIYGVAPGRFRATGRKRRYAPDSHVAFLQDGRATE